MSEKTYEELEENFNQLRDAHGMAAAQYQAFCVAIETSPYGKGPTAKQDRQGWDDLRSKYIRAFDKMKQAWREMGGAL